MRDFIDVNIGVVTKAGENTAASSTEWSTWGDRIRSAFDLSRSDVRDDTVRASLETYGSDVEQGARTVASQVEALGHDTTSAAHTVDNADAEAADALARQGQAGDRQADVLRRPINGPVPV